jgi:hypothetical protein
MVNAVTVSPRRHQVPVKPNRSVKSSEWRSPEAVWGKFARDFPLEEDGFEPSVPLYILTVSDPSCRLRGQT